MNEYAFDVDESSFDEKVLGCGKPVVVDFWAPWCAPCKMLKPLLEKLAGEYGGRFLLAKVNSDENPELARRYNVRGIPDVRVFSNGEVVDGFTGALPESALRDFLDKAVPSPSETLRLNAKSHPESARKLLEEALEIDPGNDRARLDLAEILAGRGEPESAKALLAMIRNPSPQYDRIMKNIAFSEAGKSDEAALKRETDSGSADARIRLAMLYASKQEFEKALELLLAVVRKDRKNDEARKTMIDIFDLASNQPELVSRYRRLLGSLLH